MYLSTVWCVHICEKQLLKLIMNLLKYYTFTGANLALKKSPLIIDADKHHLLLSTTCILDKKQLLAVGVLSHIIVWLCMSRWS